MVLYIADVLVCCVDEDGGLTSLDKLIEKLKRTETKLCQITITIRAIDGFVFKRILLLTHRSHRYVATVR